MFRYSEKPNTGHIAEMQFHIALFHKAPWVQKTRVSHSSEVIFASHRKSAGDSDLV